MVRHDVITSFRHPGWINSCCTISHLSCCTMDRLFSVFTARYQLVLFRVLITDRRPTEENNFINEICCLLIWIIAFPVEATLFNFPCLHPIKRALCINHYSHWTNRIHSLRHSSGLIHWVIDWTVPLVARYFRDWRFESLLSPSVM